MYRILDVATGRYVSIAAFFTRERAQESIDAWRERCLRGERQDIPFERFNRMVIVEFD